MSNTQHAPKIPRSYFAHLTTGQCLEIVRAIEKARRRGGLDEGRKERERQLRRYGITNEVMGRIVRQYDTGSWSWEQ